MSRTPENMDTNQLIDYLKTHYLSETALINKLGINEKQLKTWQCAKRIPKASYELSIKTYFKAPGLEKLDAIKWRFYPTSCTIWAKSTAHLTSTSSIQQHFSSQYKIQILTLMQIYGFPKSVAETYTHESHIKAKWNHFLSGVLGVTCLSTLPKDIATQSIALEMLDYLTLEGSKRILAEDQIQRLSHWVACLEELTPPQGPNSHEELEALQKKIKASKVRHLNPIAYETLTE